MNITCIIVEDEPLALKRTEMLVLKTPNLDLLGCFENALDALSFLQKNTVDLIFLDIQMDELTGIEFLESSNITSQVIFTTAYEEYALKGYELNVLDYLLKPFNYARFLQAVNKFQKVTPPEKDYTFIKSGYQLEKVCFNDILFVEGMGDYRRIHTANKKIMTLQTFTELQEILPEPNFKRIHKSYLIAIDKIDNIERNLVVIAKNRLPISATYKSNFFESLQIDKK